MNKKTKYITNIFFAACIATNSYSKEPKAIGHPNQLANSILNYSHKTTKPIKNGKLHTIDSLQSIGMDSPSGIKVGNNCYLKFKKAEYKDISPEGWSMGDELKYKFTKTIDDVVDKFIQKDVADSGTNFTRWDSPFGGGYQNNNIINEGENIPYHDSNRFWIGVLIDADQTKINKRKNDIKK
jgi:hypothetical protein